MTSQTSIEDRLKVVQELFDVNQILNRQSDQPKQVAKYYRYNRLTYYLLNSRQGFVHLGLSKDNKFKKSDFLGQAEIIASYLKKSKARQVLELAPGKAATTSHLATRFSNVNFTGIDLPDGQLKTNALPNMKLVEGDYHQL